MQKFDLYYSKKAHVHSGANYHKILKCNYTLIVKAGQKDISFYKFDDVIKVGENVILKDNEIIYDISKSLSRLYSKKY